MRAKTTAAVTQQKALWLLEMLFPRIGKRPINATTFAPAVPVQSYQSREDLASLNVGETIGGSYASTTT
jgi:hypothetical protein